MAAPKSTQKSSRSAASSSRKGVAPPPPPEPKPPVERYTVKTEFWDSVLGGIPPWVDEIAAIVLLIFGIVSFLSLLSVSGDNTIASAWANALFTLFGFGSAIVCAAVFALGVILLLPKVGVVVRFPARRILALEIAFLASLALLHLVSGDGELRSLARLGRGGGQVGWALSSITTLVVGAPVSILIYLLILAAAVAVVAGVRRHHLLRGLKAVSHRLHYEGRRLKPAAPAHVVRVNPLSEAMQRPVSISDGAATTLVMPTEAQAQRIKSFNIVRIRANTANLPPSLRAAAAAAANAATAPSAPAKPVIYSAEPQINFDAIGIIQGKPGRGGGSLPVKRPDGRMKRYFTVSGLREPTTTPRRSQELPPLELLGSIELNVPDEREINHNVVLIENTLLEFDIDVDVVDVCVGPTVTQYALQPYRETTNTEGEVTFSRTRINKIASLSSDLALALSAKRLRLETPVPGQNYIGIEVPNRKPSTVALRSVYESRAYVEESARRGPLFVPLGRDVAGAPVGIDLAAMPHLLIAGTTGSGKSVCIAAMAIALIMNNTPETVQMVLLDPKMVELSRFNGVPHLLGPVETEPERIIGVLRWCTREMERRYVLLEQAGVRNIDGYNTKLGKKRKDEHLSFIVILIDEIGDLMMQQPDETEKQITRLAQMARAVGMHLVVATQRPSTDVITGLIKANFPARISFAVASGIDSRVILDSVGAETLMGRGDLLYQAPDAMQTRRVQGCFISDDEVRAVTQFWKDWTAALVEMGEREPAGHGPWERGLTRREVLADTDPLLENAIALVVAEGEASTSLLQRRMSIGHPRAARIMDLLLEMGIVGELKADRRSREVRIKPGQDPFRDVVEQRMQDRRSDSSVDDDAIGDPDGPDDEDETWYADDEDEDLS
ncbi:MAG TPA: DNA translocase FtsK [Candidatus Limnocylindrales bacterium]|nr:DNA translocase FtsK [Candidatus Limnocylindrales bacterium]